MGTIITETESFIEYMLQVSDVPVYNSQLFVAVYQPTFQSYSKLMFPFSHYFQSSDAHTGSVLFILC